MPNTRQDGEPLDPRIIQAITLAVKDEMKPINERLTSIDKSLIKLVEIEKRVTDLEKSVQFTSDRMDSLVNELLPSLADHVRKVSNSLAQQTLQMDVHRRKWNMIIHGIDGAAGEDEGVTRAKCVKFAKDVLKVNDADNTHFQACHRLSRKINAGVIVRFCDLKQKDSWLSGTKHLRDYNKKVSISPDIPPVLRPIKDNLMLKRSELEPTIKAKSRVRYLPQWPFVELRIEGQRPTYPAETLESVTAKILGFDPLLVVKESVVPLP